jgi:hypothetical protein
MAETWNNIRYVLDRFLKVDIWAYAVVIWTFGNETFGPNFWGVVILAQLMIVFDTELKWVYLSKKYIYDTYQPEDPLENISLRKAICYFFKSETWQKGYLESRGFSRILEKMLLYNATIIVAFYAAKVIPPIHAFGNNGNDFCHGVNLCERWRHTAKIDAAVPVNDSVQTAAH